MFSKAIFVLIILTLALSFGCASFSGGELPTYTYSQIEKADKKSIVSFDVRAYSPYGKDQSAEAYMNNTIPRVLTSSLSFAQMASDPNKTNSDYHFTFYFRTDQNASAVSSENITKAFSFATLFILPAYHRVDYNLTVDVMQSDSIIRTYTYRDHMTTWVEVLMLFVSPLFPPREIEQSTIDNMLMNFAHDFSHDLNAGALKQTGTAFDFPAKPDQNNALIYVVRPSAHDRWGAFIFLDDKKIGFNRGSEYIFFSASPGTHEILSDGSLAELPFDVKSGDIIFFRQDEKRDNTCCNLRVIDLQEARYQIRNSHAGTLLKAQESTPTM